jgi:hypothetical protein
MAVKANLKINTGEKIYEPGEIITSLSKAEEKRLVKNGYAEAVKGELPTSGKQTAEPNTSDNDDNGGAGPDTGYPGA